MTNLMLLMGIFSMGILTTWSGTNSISCLLLVQMITFFWVNRHVVMGLIQLEMLTVMSVLILVTQSEASNLNLAAILVLLVVGVLEASLGLALVAGISRTTTSELSMFNL